MPNIEIKIKAWKFIWIKRAIKNKHNAWIATIDTKLKDIKLTDLIKFSNLKNNPACKHCQFFYINILNYLDKQHILSIYSMCIGHGPVDFAFLFFVSVIFEWVILVLLLPVCLDRDVVCLFLCLLSLRSVRGAPDTIDT